MRTLLIGPALFALLVCGSSHAPAATQCQGQGPYEHPGAPLLCTKTYQINGPCEGDDAVTRVTITGYPPQPAWHIKPFEDVAITIRGVTLAQYAGGRISYAMAGNNFVPDIMAIIGMGETSSRTPLPAGTGMPFPGRAEAKADHYLDLHIVCKGEPFGLFYMIQYTVP